ncbi:MAG: glycerol kinase [Limisphaerales bacterium]|nr:MAG: glycerol kinase [Limisphaerales bacterium]KAG0507311.1 MAG: glycerol kinase [Limisphaerales bacterium]TXT47868.1 MAG: glycerol kinase [Limisphaerales bacterium]
MSRILAIDQSTSATKAVLFDATGALLAKSSRDHRQIYPQPGWVEHDAEEIWQNVLAVIRDLAARHDLSQLAGLSLTNQRETIVVFDRQTGQPLHHALVWQDRRGDALCQKLREQGREKLVQAKTGLKIDTYFSASKLAWLIENKPDLAAKLRDGSAVIGTMDAYLIHRLTGGSVFATDHTNASRTLLFDVARHSNVESGSEGTRHRNVELRWDAELCDLFGVPMNALPEVRESASHFGETNADGALPRRVPIVGVMGDSQASLFAQRCFAPGATKATFGTGTSVLLNIGSQFKPAGQGAVTALAWVHKGTPTYASEGIINFSAATVAWLKDQLGLVRDAAESEALALAVPDNGGVYLVPAFAGLSAPYWSPDARAAIVGMTAHTRREHIVRAALESIAYQLRDVLDMMRGEAGVGLQSLHADGGPTRNQFLMQFTADLTGVELSVADVAESSAWGAAMNGLLALGEFKSLDELAALPRSTRTYSPRMPAAEVKRLHDGWLAAVKRIL